MPDPESTLSRKRSQKEFEELLLKDVLIEFEAGDGEFWEQKAMELAGQPGYTPTPEQRAAFEERLDLEVKRIQKLEQEISQIPEGYEEHVAALEAEHAQKAEIARRSKRRCILRKVGSIAAVFVLFIIMTMYHTVDAFAAGVDRFIATVVLADGAEELRIEEKKDAGLELNMEDYVGMYMPERVPRGYSVSAIEINNHTNRIIYSDKNNNTIQYEISKTKSSVFVDDEDIVENRIYVLDTWARVLDTGTVVYIIWEDDNHIYTVSGNANLRDQLIKMVEKSVKIELEN